jgi:ComEC/Rec2-related protein
LPQLVWICGCGSCSMVELGCKRGGGWGMVAEIREGLSDERLMLRPDLGALVPAERPPSPVQTPGIETAARSLAGLLPKLSRAKAEVAQLAETEISLGTPFNLLPAFVGLGAIIYFTMASEPALGPIAVVFMLAVAASWLTSSRQLVRIASIAVAALSAGMLFAKIETISRESILLGEQISTRVTGRVLSLEITPRGQRAVVEVLSTERPQLKFQPERIKVTLRKAPEGLAPGEGIKALFLLRPPSGPVRPGSFDFGFDSYFDRIGASGVSISPVERVELPALGALRQMMFWFERQRVAIAANIRGKIGGQSGEMSAALIAGLGGGINAETNEAMRVSGLAHVTSISGLHMALVAGSVMGMIRLILALFPNFASRYPIKKFAASSALAGAFIYLLLSGGGVATMRSFIMLAVMLIAILFDRAALTMRNLVIAAIIILAFAPHEIMGPSFQMSFAATAALIAGYQIYSQWRLRRPSNVPIQGGLVQRATRAGVLFVLGILATSLVAGLATAIYSAYHFNRIAPMGLIANLIAMPAVSIIVMPMALLAVLLMPLGLEAGPLWLMGKGVDFMLAVAHWSAGVSSAGDVGAIPVASFVLFTVALLAFCLPNTKLRFAVIPLGVLALGLVFLRTDPDIAISEDAKLIAVRGDDGSLSLNQGRPNRFTLENWQRAYRANSASSDRGNFNCEDGFCSTAGASSVKIGHLTDKARFAEACDAVDLLVVTFPIDGNRCGSERAYLITPRQLARRGAAEVRIDDSGEGRPRFEVTQAIESTERPWQRHRIFSRAARNMEPYVSKKQAAAKPALDGAPAAH